MKKKRRDLMLTKFRKIWDWIGKDLCKESKINYCSVDEFMDQKLIHLSKVKPFHYIFCMDSSSSMSGDRWEDL